MLLTGFGYYELRSGRKEHNIIMIFLHECHNCELLCVVLCCVVLVAGQMGFVLRQPQIMQNVLKDLPLRLRSRSESERERVLQILWLSRN